MSIPRTAARLLLGGALAFAGASHLTFARDDFRAQVPNNLVKPLPVSEDQVVLASGVAEIVLGVALLSGVKKKTVGRIAAAFFVAVFPGNLSQLANRASAFGLNTDRKRALRLLGQPVLVATSLWSTSSPAR